MITAFEDNQMRGMILCTCLVFFAFVGCSTNSPTRTGAPELAPVALKVSLEQSPQLDPVSYLVLTVTARDMDTIRKTIQVHNSSFEDTLTVPLGAEPRVFVLEAKSSEDKTLYEGCDTVEIVGGQTVTVEIELLPAVLMIKLTPRYSHVQQDSVFNLDVEVYDVDSLFGASFRIEFNSNLLECLGADTVGPQGIMGAGDSFIFFDTTGTDYVAVSITKKYPAVPVSGSGSLARLNFRALSTGTGDLAFSDETLKLVRADGSSIPYRDSLVADQAIVDIVQ